MWGINPRLWDTEDEYLSYPQEEGTKSPTKQEDRDR